MMEPTYWLKQTKPLFPELEWNKPERRDQAGRLLIIGGNLHNLAVPIKAYDLALKNGIGNAKVLLPAKTKKLIMQGVSLLQGYSLLETAVNFLPSTSSGEFSSESGRELLEYALGADTVLFPGNLGRNSQTSILVEDFLRSFSGQIILACDAIETVANNPELLLTRPQTTLVLSFAQLQKIAKRSNNSQLITYGMSLIRLVDTLHLLTTTYPVAIVTVHQSQILVAASGKVSTTKISEEEPKTWRVAAASYAACFQTWNPGKTLEALTHAVSLIY